MQISQPTINIDFVFLRQQAKRKIRKYIDERLPEEYEKCLVGLNSIVREVRAASQQTQDRREKIQALSLAKECYAMKLELLTNATVVGDAIRFVTYDASNNTSTRIQGQGQEEEAVKPKAETSILGSTEEDNDIQRWENRSEDLTTNSIF